MGGWEGAGWEECYNIDEGIDSLTRCKDKRYLKVHMATHIFVVCSRPIRSCYTDNLFGLLGLLTFPQHNLYIEPIYHQLSNKRS